MLPAAAHDLRKCPSVTRTRAGLVKIATDMVAADKQINITSKWPARWSGIAGHVCPPAVPPHGDDVSVITWMYWAAFGKGPDQLNRLGWLGGSLASLAARGTPRSVTTYLIAKPSYVVWKRADHTKAQLGDLLMYGTPARLRHVAMYLGNGQVFSFAPPAIQGGAIADGSPLTPRIRAWDFRADLHAVYAYPDFLI